MAKKAPPPKTVTDMDRAEQVCGFITEGESVRESARRADIEATKFYRLLAAEGNDQLVKQYLRAREARADKRFEDIEEIKIMLLAKHIDPQSANVIINATFRQIGKENAQRYGDKLDVTSDNKPLPIPVLQILPLKEVS